MHWDSYNKENRITNQGHDPKTSYKDRYNYITADNNLISLFGFTRSVNNDNCNNDIDDNDNEDLKLSEEDDNDKISKDNQIICNDMALTKPAIIQPSINTLFQSIEDEQQIII